MTHPHSSPPRGRTIGGAIAATALAAVALALAPGSSSAAEGAATAAKKVAHPPAAARHAPPGAKRAGKAVGTRLLGRRALKRAAHKHQLVTSRRRFRVPPGTRMGPIVISDARSELWGCYTWKRSWGVLGRCDYKVYDAMGYFGWWRYDYYYSYPGRPFVYWYADQCVIGAGVCRRV